MAEAAKCALVTGANKGIGFGVCEQLAAQGIKVLLTARDEQRGLEAVKKLAQRGLPVLFHQLDVTSQSSVDSLSAYIKTHFNRLDILVNNAGVIDMIWKEDTGEWQQNPDQIKQCVNINYYGAKRTLESMIPFLQSSNAPMVVNVSSSMGKLECVKNEWAKGVLGDAENLTEEKVDEVLQKFLEEAREGVSGNENFSAYRISKAAMNAYTRIIAKKYPSVCVNSVCPGYVQTDMNNNKGILSVEEGAESVVRLALLPSGSQSGCFFARQQLVPF